MLWRSLPDRADTNRSVTLYYRAAVVFILLAAGAILSYWHRDPMLGVQSAIILASVVFLGLQAKDAHEQRQDEARVREEDFRDKARRDTIARLTHTTTTFRRREREFLNELIVHCNSAAGNSVAEHHDFKPERTALTEMVKGAYVTYEYRGGERGEFAHPAFKAADERDAVEFLTLMKGRQRGIESVTIRQARILNAHFPTQSYLREMLTQYELLGVGILQGAFSFTSLDGAVGTQIVDAFLRWQNFVYEHRRRPRKCRVFNYFQTLAAFVVHSRAIRVVLDATRSSDWTGLEKALRDLKPASYEARERGEDVDDDGVAYEDFEREHFEQAIPPSDRWWLRQASRSCFRPLATAPDAQAQRDAAEAEQALASDGEGTVVPPFDPDALRPLLVDMWTGKLLAGIPNRIRETILWATEEGKQRSTPDDGGGPSARTLLREASWYADFMSLYNPLTGRAAEDLPDQRQENRVAIYRRKPTGFEGVPGPLPRGRGTRRDPGRVNRDRPEEPPR